VTIDARPSRIALRTPSASRIDAGDGRIDVCRRRAGGDLVAHDEDTAREFVTRTLGELATADRVLREALRTYIREEFSPTCAAKVLFTHRNTVLNRLGRAKDMFPIPLSGRGMEVGLALEMVRWLGSRP
jgi:DNA-binding PucR family transcriptional regulator